MKKHIFPIGFLCIIPISAVTLVIYCLETYYETVHNESSFLIMIYCFIAFIVSTIIWINIRKEHRCVTIIWIISTVMLILAFYVGNKIPFCVECDRVIAEDLGFLIHWIRPVVPPQ